MVTTVELLARLQSRGIKLFLAGGELKFRALKGAITASDRAALAERRQEIAAYLRALEAGIHEPITFTASPPVPSVLQEMWWRLTVGLPRQLQLERVPLLQKFSGVSASQAQAAIRAILARHHTLRACFREKHGTLTVGLNPTDSFVIDLEDFSAASGRPALESEVRERALEFTNRELPVDGQWVTRAKLICLPGHETLVVWVFNHIVADAYSLMLILEELTERLAGREPPLPVSVPFTDYAAWERSWVRSAERQPLIHYWERWLRDQPALRTPRGRKSLEWQPGQRVDYKFSFEPPVLRRINEFAARLHTSAFNVYLTIFALALARWSGQDVVPIRCIGDLRTSMRLSSVVGYLVCSDIVQFTARSDGDFAAMLRANEMEYHSSILLRLPTLLRHPAREGGGGIEDPSRIAASINMFSAQRRLRGAESAPTGDSAEDYAWPPQVERTSLEAWPIPLPTIYLRLMDFGHVMHGSLELNDELMDEDEQRSLVTTFLEIAADYVLHEPRQPALRKATP